MVKYGYWRNEKNVIEEYRIALKDFSGIPSIDELKTKEYGGLESAIRYHGGIKFLEKYGFKQKRKAQNYWRDFNNVRKQLKPAVDHCIKKHNRLPRYDDLAELGFGSLLNAIDKSFGGLTRVYIQLGYSTKRKPMRYWNDFKKVETEVKPFVAAFLQKKRRLPTTSDLRQFGKQSFITAIKKYGGLSIVYARLGFEPNKKPIGYWNKQNINDEIEPIINKFLREKKRSPTTDELIKLKGYSLENAIQKQYGGLARFYLERGYKLNKKPNKYWNDKNNVKKELIVLNERWLKNHKLPMTNKELSETENNAIRSALHDHQYDLYDLYKEIGFDAIRRKKPVGYWKSRKNVTNELKNLVKDFLKKNKMLPNQSEISKMNPSLAITITKMGGMREVYKSLGYDDSDYARKPPYYWNNFDNLKNELLNLTKKLGHFPTGDDFCKFGFSSIPQIVRAYHGGMVEVRKRLGFELERKPNGYWLDINNLEKELKEVIIKLGHFPTQMELANLKLTRLIHVVNEKYGGLRKLKQILGYSRIRSVEEFEYFVEQEKTARQVIQRFGGDSADVADILAVIYEHRISRKEILELLDNMSLSNYLGAMYNPFRSVKDLIETSEALLPQDKENIIHDIIYKKALEYRRKKIGPVPSDTERKSFSSEIKFELEKLRKGEMNERIKITRQFFEELYDDTLELFKMHEKGIEGIVHSVKNEGASNGTL